MPTLSPHPPTVMQSPLDKTHTPDQPAMSAGSVTNSPQQNSTTEVKSGEPGTPANVSNVAPVVLKKPVLCSKEYETALEEEEQSLDLLYDYSTLDAW